MRIDLLALCLVLALAAACGPAPAPTRQLNPVTLSGEGDDVIDVGHLSGYATAELDHHGERNFIVRPYDAEGNPRQSLVNEVGRYNGTVMWDKQAHTLQITADGRWTIILRQ